MEYQLPLSQTESADNLVPVIEQLRTVPGHIMSEDDEEMLPA